ncbi:MAG: LPS-assembly protein LptD [Pelagibacteraceae bacterium TMED124]|nr:MAG: LPS-assembly protein LptD [Pelagibacteraceae bacterium TMED124]
MKNSIKKFIIVLSFLFIPSINGFTDELDVSAYEVQLNKESKIIYANGNVQIMDNKKNIIFTEKAEYNKINEVVRSFGDTDIVTSEKFRIQGEDIFYDNIKQVIYSNKKSVITDINGNKIYTDMFKYLTEKNMFFSQGDVKVVDKRDNEYLFSEIYIDEKKRKIVGSDVRSFFNDPTFKTNEKNEPRFFANSGFIDDEGVSFNRGIFTPCQNREGKKCPPWSIQAEKIKHSQAKKTVYYDKAILKIYDFPIFYFPKFFHPGPTVKRRSGFLFPTLVDNSSVGFSASVPYFWALAENRDMTLTPKIYTKENLLVLHEYRHAFDNSYLVVDSSYTKGYKKTDRIKKSEGSRSHFFSRFTYDWSKEEYSSNLEVNLQHVSNDTYLKVHDINTELVNKDNNIIKKDLNYEFQDDKNYLSVSAAMFENLTSEDSDKTRFEYSLPNILFERNLFTGDKAGVFDIRSNAFVKNYKVDQTTKFWVNDINWQSNPFTSLRGVQNKFKGLFKVVNYEADNAEKFKTDGLNSEISAALSYDAKLPLSKKNDKTGTINFLTPQISLRHAPGHMRNLQNDGLKLNYSNLFMLNKNSQPDVIEEGTSAVMGLEISNNNLEDSKPGEKNYSLSIGQIYNFQENSSLPSTSSLDQKASDLVGEAYLRLSDNFTLSNNFSVDHNFNDINYNDLEANLILGNTSFNLNYLEENNHVGTSNYIKSGVKVDFNNSGELTFDIKKNLETDSTEFYDLAYDYVNDCLKAGLLFRREFYSDKDVEASDSLIFRITLFPFGEAKSPLIDR